MNPRRRSTVLYAPISLILAASVLPAANAADDTPEIEPLFRSQCYSCHQGEKANAGLHLDLKASVFASGPSGKAVVAGNSKSSELLNRLISADPKKRMPLGGTALAAEKIELIRTWIDQGAQWPDEERTSTHWSYVKPARPAIPKVANSAWG